jgi:hypothetical protein
MSDEILRPPLNVTLTMSAEIYEELQALARANEISMPQLFWEGVQLYRQKAAPIQSCERVPGLAQVVQLDQFNSSR